MTDEELVIIKERFPVVFNELFESKKDIADQFRITESVLEPLEIIYAYYDIEMYEGNAAVVYYNPQDKTYYEVHGFHCSCYGLEDQWEPEEIGMVTTFIEYIERTK